jgi:hypothetical protein
MVRSDTPKISAASMWEAPSTRQTMTASSSSLETLWINATTRRFAPTESSMEPPHGKLTSSSIGCPTRLRRRRASSARRVLVRYSQATTVRVSASSVKHGPDCQRRTNDSWATSSASSEEPRRRRHLALTEGRKRTYAFGKLDSGAKQVLKGIDVRAPSIRPIKATRSLARTAGDAFRLQCRRCHVGFVRVPRFSTRRTCRDMTSHQSVPAWPGTRTARTASTELPGCVLPRRR